MPGLPGESLVVTEEDADAVLQLHMPELDAEQIDRNAQVRAVQTGSEPLRTASRVLV